MMPGCQVLTPSRHLTFDVRANRQHILRRLVAMHLPVKTFCQPHLKIDVDLDVDGFWDANCACVFSHPISFCAKGSHFPVPAPLGCKPVGPVEACSFCAHKKGAWTCFPPSTLKRRRSGAVPRLLRAMVGSRRCDSPPPTTFGTYCHSSETALPIIIEFTCRN